MTTYRGKRYTPEQLDSITENEGYLHWPKIQSGECYGDDRLGERLEDPALLEKAGEDYAASVRAMREGVEEAIAGLRMRGIKKVRLGASWAEYDSSGGRQWIMWYIRAFRDAGLDVLPCLNYTPGRFAEARIELMRGEADGDAAKLERISELRPYTNVPPHPVEAFADYVDRFLEDNSAFIGEWVELWNEPNLDTDWNMDEYDPDGKVFVDMLAPASKAARARGKKVLLGGLTKFNESIEWLEKTCSHGLIDHIDALGLHGLRGTWSDRSVLPPWRDRIRQFKSLMSSYSDKDVPVWMTEVGFTTIDLELSMDESRLEEIQAAIYADLALTIADGDAERVYWYTLRDHVTPSVRFLTTGWEDPLQHFFGDTDLAGNAKLLRTLLETGGPLAVLDHVEKHGLWPLADAIIDRGDPGTWTPEIPRIIEEMERTAREKNGPRLRKAA